MQVYLLVNLVVAMGMLENGEYLELPRYARMVDEFAGSMFYVPQQGMHQKFLDRFSKDVKTSLPEIHRDLHRLRDYLRSVFSLLYRYDIVLRECGIDPKWEEEIAFDLIDVASRCVRGGRCRAV